MGQLVLRLVDTHPKKPLQVVPISGFARGPGKARDEAGVGSSLIPREATLRGRTELEQREPLVLMPGWGCNTSSELSNHLSPVLNPPFVQQLGTCDGKGESGLSGESPTHRVCRVG